MSSENVEIVRRVLDGLTTGDTAAAMSQLDPEIEFDMSIRPEGSVSRGHEGLLEAMRTWIGTWRDWTLEVEELLDAGDQVLAAHRESGLGKGSGVPLSQTTYCVYTLRAGKVTRIEAFHTEADARRAAGLET
jgi:ketosteroid isomerase-like protein